MEFLLNILNMSNFHIIHTNISVDKLSNMATEALRPDPIKDSVEALSREAEQLKSKLDDERAKLNDVDCK